MRPPGLGSKPRSPVARYALAAACVALAVLTRRLLADVLSDREPFPTFYVAVTIAAWYGGLGPTVFALVLGYLAADWFFIAPQKHLSALNLANTGTYFFVGFSIAFFTEITRAAQARAEASAAEARIRRVELEREVGQRRRVELEREQLLDQLETARGRLEGVLRQMPAGVVIAEAPSGKLVLANEQVQQIWRRPLGPAAGLRDLLQNDGFHPGGQPYRPHEWPLARSIEAGAVVVDEEIDYLRGDGSLGVMCVSSAPIRDPAGRILAAVAVFADVTGRKQAEEALRRAHEELERRVGERTAELARANEALQVEVAERRQAEAARAELLQRLVTVQEEERGRIARELHDQMGQLLAALSLGLESLKESTPMAPSLRDRLQRLCDLARRIGREMHRLAWELGPSALEEFDLITALSNYVEEWSGHSGVAVQFHCTGPWKDRLPTPLESALYRIIQEALTNVLKHSRARRLSLILERRRDHLLAIVEDDGVGFDPAATTSWAREERRLGLAGMRQRAELVEGSLQIESSPGGGTTLFVRIPLPAPGSRTPNGQAAHLPGR